MKFTSSKTAAAGTSGNLGARRLTLNGDPGAGPMLLRRGTHDCYGVKMDLRREKVTALVYLCTYAGPMLLRRANVATPENARPVVVSKWTCGERN